MLSLFMTPFLILLGIPLAITLATPARYLPFYLLWLAMLSLLVMSWPGGTDHSSPFSGLGEAIEAIFLGCCIVFVALKMAAAHAWNWTRDAADRMCLRCDGSDGFALVLAGMTGLFAAPWSMLLLALLFSAGSSAVLAHGSTSVVLVVAAWLLATSRTSANGLMQTFAGALLGSAVITLVMGGICVSARIADVIDGAESMAGGHPYCIQIDTAHGGYRPAVTRLDVSPLMMRAHCSGGWCFANHGILAIASEGGTRLMNWSYRYRSFRTEVLNAPTEQRPAVACEPSRGFAHNLPLL